MTNQIIWLFVLAIPIACIAWTVTHEEIFKEPRSWCIAQSKRNKSLILRKCFYMFTCEYCFSHYVTILFIAITGYTLLLPGWRGYIIAGFSLVWVANLYMGLFALIRQAIKAEKTHIELEEHIIDQQEQKNEKAPPSNGKRTLIPGKPLTDHWKDM